MQEIRYDRISEKRVIISEVRSKRPIELSDLKKEDDIPEYSLKCPFCSGNEEKTPVEVFRIGTPWKARVVFNKFPIVGGSEVVQEENRFFSKSKAEGKHYVIVDSCKHNNYLSKMTEDDIDNLVICYKEVYKMLSKDKKTKYIQIYKNYGREAGASLEHTHSQVMSLNFIPDDILKIIKNSSNYYSDNGSCYFCDMIKYELSVKKRALYENDYFVIIAPAVSLYPYEMIIYPKFHLSSISQLEEKKITYLSRAISFAAKTLYKRLGNPAYNMYLNSMVKEGTSFHMSITIIPRISIQAGFENSTGIMVNTISPERFKKMLEL